MLTPNAFDLANDHTFRALLGNSPPPRPAIITAVNGAEYTLLTSDADNAELTAVALNGWQYEVDDVVYIMQAANAPDNALILGTASLPHQLGIGAAAPQYGPLVAANTTGGHGILTRSNIAGTLLTLLPAATINHSIYIRILLDDFTDSGSSTFVLDVPPSSYNGSNIVVGATTIQVRAYATGSLQVLRTAGAATPSCILSAIWI
ncbi:hypothetical protein LCGC14_1103530 [marine sediment metagenome]|uniref:Uncharacterized protein n=1 Tax=marine sediment metagenome TaxID=412755 RepID=A0A0F9PS05_9ZZZZ